MLDRRPDIRSAEQNLIAANARVGVAKAAFFPSITLTALGGYQSADLLGVVQRSGFAYSLGGAVDLPIFDAGRRSGNYNTAKAQNQELLIAYQRSIYGAFQEVSDALIGFQKSKEYTVSQTLLAERCGTKARSRTSAISAVLVAISRFSIPNVNGLPPNRSLRRPSGMF